jgi:hypothetical protein
MIGAPFGSRHRGFAFQAGLEAATVGLRSKSAIADFDLAVFAKRKPLNERYCLFTSYRDQDLSPESTMPSMKYFWPAKYRATAGPTDMQEAAMIAL